MKQTQRSNSYLGTAEEIYFKERTSYEKDVFHKDFTRSLKEIRKKIRTTCDSFPYTKTSNEILDLNTRYTVQFSKISWALERWAAQRRRLIRKIEGLARSLNQTKSYSSKGRLVFSTIDIAGTLGSLALTNLNVSWSSKVLYTAAAFGCMSFVCSLIEISKTKFSIEDALKEIREDSESMQTLLLLIQRMNEFDKGIHALFPHGIDTRIVRMIQNPQAVSSDNLNDLQHIIQALTSVEDNVQIWLAVVLSNVRKDPKLMEDEDFLEKVEMFSKSTAAEKWWNRIKYKDLPSSSGKSQLQSELTDYLKVDSVPFHAIPLLSAPVWYLNGLHTVGSIILNSLVVFDSYCELTRGFRTQEVDTLRRLKSFLQKEHDNVVDIYDRLNPHSDE